MNKDGEGRRHVPCLWNRTPYPHDAGKLRMLVHTNLYRTIEYKRSRTLRLFQRFEQRDGPDLTTVFQLDSELTTPAQSHNMAVQQLTAFCFCASHLTTTPVFHPLAPLVAIEPPGWSRAGSPAHSGPRWPWHGVARSPRPTACLGSLPYRADCVRASDSAASPGGSPPPDTLTPDFYARWPHRPGRLHPVPRRHRSRSARQSRS